MKLQKISRLVVFLVVVAVGSVGVAGAKAAVYKLMPAKVNVVKSRRVSAPKSKVSVPKTVKPAASKKTSR